MKLLETTALTIRLLSIYFFFKSLGILAFYISQLMSNHEGDIQPASTLFLGGAGFIIFTIGAYGCFMFSVSISTWLLPKITDQSPVLKGDLETIQLAAFTIIGVFILADTLPTLVHDAIYLWLRSDAYSHELSSLFKPDLPSLYWGYTQFFVSLFKVSIGMYLLFGASGLIGIIQKLRTAGSKP